MPPSRAPRRKACQALLPDGTTPCSATFRGWGRYCPAHLDEHARLAGQYKDAAARAERLRRQGELADRQVRALSSVSTADRALERVRGYLCALGEERRAREAYLRRFPAESASTLQFSASRSFARARARAVGSASASASGSGGEGWSGGEGEGQGEFGPGGAGSLERSSSRGSRFTDDERHEQRLADLQEREAACAALIERLQQRREEIVAAMQARRGGRESSQVDLEREPLLAAARESRPSRWGRVGWAWRIALLAILLGVIPLVVALTFLKRVGVSKSASI